MTNSVIHYALGAGLASLSGLRGRDRALVALFAIAPDLDVVTAVPWLLAAPHLPLDAGLLTTGAYLFGHRGLSHTLWAALLCALVVWWVTGSRRWGAGAGLAWFSQLVVDSISPWPTTPFWPASTTEVHLPLITGSDPLTTLVALAALAVLLGPMVADRFSTFTAQTRARLRRVETRWSGPLIALAGAGLLLNVAAIGATAALADVPGSQVHPAHFPRTVTVEPAPSDETTDAWTIGLRWVPWGEPELREIDRVREATNGTGLAPAILDERVAHAACTLDHLGPYSPIDDPVWVLRNATRDAVVLEAVDLVRNATEGGGPTMTFLFLGDELERVSLGASEGRFQIAVPAPVVAATPCPP